ncbi:MAG: hypothetical protein RL141_249 [Candidatus Parcubacteria bacterium]
MYENPRFRTFAQCREVDPAKTAAIAAQANAWKVHIVDPDGNEISIPPGSDVSFTGPSGSGRIGVACSDTGDFQYDKFVLEQFPGVAVVAWGVKDGVVKLAWLTQTRPFAVDQERPGRTKPIAFGQIPMGFIETRFDKSLENLIYDAVVRELQEETGADHVISVSMPDPGTYWQDPTCMSNGTYVAFAQVDLGRISATTQHGHEQIKKAEFLPVEEVLRRISKGWTEDGVVHHMGLSLGPLMMFFARFPHFFPHSPSP